MQFVEDRGGRERGRERWREWCEGGPEEEGERREEEEISSESKEKHHKGTMMFTIMLHDCVSWQRPPQNLLSSCG